jgi:hypothetical protein
VAGASATAAVFSRLEPAPHFDVSAYHDEKCFPQVLDTTSLKTFVAKNEIGDKKRLITAETLSKSARARLLLDENQVK